ncbi:MAG TPA: Do family serine endopeptidase, partial [Burkholderiales bacterium]|nr:Do family serine endopeptidase [Burkholderiales bacterium]
EGVSVVNVSSTRTVRRPEGPVPGLSPEDPLYEMFRRLLPPVPREYQAQSLGSGFIISEDGYLLTNAHVVAEMEEVTVKLLDRREFKAKVVGMDERTDVALLKIGVKGLRKVTIGDAAKLEVGEWVAAIGSPFGFENSVTAGIVSAKGRFVPDETFVPFIQSDVAVNPGNSGGPLFNLRGEVVGINSMIYSGSGGYMGLSFAVPIDVAVSVANELRSHGRVIRGRLGVRIQELNPDLARAFGVKATTGALILMVEPGSPADKAGLAPGDIVLKIDGKALDNWTDLPQRIGATPPGRTVRLEIWRRGRTKELSATIAEPVAEPRLPPEAEPKRANRLGLVLGELTAAQSAELKVQGGLLILGARGTALKAGLREGDVILAMNDSALGRVGELNRLLAEAEPGATVALLVLRDDVLAYVPVRLPG